MILSEQRREYSAQHKNDAKNLKHKDEQDIFLCYKQVNSSNNLERAFDLLFEEVMKNRK